jgi:hypothetical protein
VVHSVYIEFLTENKKKITKMQEANWENVIRVTKVHQGIGEEEQGLERDRTKYEGRAVSG